MKHRGSDALERQRRELQELSRRVSRAQDYLGRGRPSPEERGGFEVRVEEKQWLLIAPKRSAYFKKVTTPPSDL